MFCDFRGVFKNSWHSSDEISFRSNANEWRLGLNGRGYESSSFISICNFLRLWCVSKNNFLRLLLHSYKEQFSIRIKKILAWYGMYSLISRYSTSLSLWKNRRGTQKNFSNFTNRVHPILHPIFLDMIGQELMKVHILSRAVLKFLKYKSSRAYDTSVFSIWKLFKLR